MWLWGLGDSIWLVLSYLDFKAPRGSSLVSSGHPLLVFCKVDMEILSLFVFLFITYHSLIHHFPYENRGDSDLWVVWVHIEEVFVVGEEYRIVDIVVFEGFVYVFIFFPFISYHVNYANVFYYHTEAVLPYDFHHTFENFYFCRAFVISLMSVDTVSMFA